MAKEKKSPQAPGQYLGYSLQQTLFLSLLLQAQKGDTVSLEFFEDVGVERESGERVAAQAKSALEGNPVSDRSVGLWKTFSNWIDAVKDRTLPPKTTTFWIYVAQNKSGQIVESFSKAKSEDSARDAISAAKQKLWGSAPKYPDKSNVADTIKEYVQQVFNDEDIACQIIRKFTLVTASGYSFDTIKELMEKLFVPVEILDYVIAHALGWIKIQTDGQLERKQPAVITYDDFHAELTTFIRKVNREHMLVSFAPAPKQHDIAIHSRTLHTYILQLQLIESDDEDKLRAISDYLWAASDRTRWGSMGLVNETSFTEFEDDLRRTWKNLDKQGRLLHSSLDEVAKGTLLYSECGNYKGRLEGLEVPSHFTPGSFHALADVLDVGWHPDYRNKIKGLLANTKRGKK